MGKNEVTNYDVLHNINTRHNNGIPLLVTTFLDNETRLGTTVNTSALSEEEEKLRFASKQFAALYNKKVKEAFSAYAEAMDSDTTNSVFKELLSKLVKLAEVELDKRIHRHTTFAVIHQKVLYLLSSIIGTSDSRALKPEETDKYIASAKEILGFVSEAFALQRMTDILNPIGKDSEGHYINIIDVLHEWDDCRRFMLDDNPPADWKEQYDDNSIVRFIGKAYEHGRPTQDYIKCMQVVEELVLWVHGDGRKYVGGFVPKSDYADFSPSSRDYGAYCLCFSTDEVAEHDIYFIFNDVGYPRNSEGEYAIAVAALNVLLTLDDEFQYNAINKGKLPGCDPTKL